MKSIDMHKYIQFSIMYFFQLSLGWQIGLAQAPVNDLPCRATFIGDLVNMSSTLTINGDNSNAGPDLSGVSAFDWQNAQAIFPNSCLGNNSWNHTLFYRFDLTPFIRGFRLRIIPQSPQAKFNTVFVPEDNMSCAAGIVSGYIHPTDPQEIMWSCATGTNETLITGCPCNYFISNGITTYPDRVYFLIGSNSASETGRFTIIIDPVLPTSCDNCLNGTESVMDDNFSTHNVTSSITRLDPGQRNGAIQIENVNGGEAPYSYQLDGGASQNSPVFASLLWGPHMLVVTDANGCRKTNSLVIPYNPMPDPVVHLPPDYCQGTVVQALQAAGVPNSTLRWYDANGTQLGTGPAYQPTLSTSATYLVDQVADGISSEQVPVKVNVLPMPDASVLGNLCVNTELKIAPGVTDPQVSWFLNKKAIPGQATTQMIPHLPGKYKVVVRKDLCTDSSEFEVLNAPLIETGEDISLCAGESTRFFTESKGATRYQWEPAAGLDDPASARPVASPLQTTTYRVKASNTSNCTAEDSVKIYVGIGPLAFFSVDSTNGEAPFRLKFKNASKHAERFFWDFGDGNTSTEREPEHTFWEGGDFKVRLTAYGQSSPCQDVMESEPLSVTQPLIRICTGLSPNGDGVNDTWVIEKLAAYPDHEVQVFNQWGNLVFRSARYESTWDGGSLPDGTYYYSVKIDREEPRKGYLTLIR